MSFIQALLDLILRISLCYFKASEKKIMQIYFF